VEHDGPAVSFPATQAHKSFARAVLARRNVSFLLHGSPIGVMGTDVSISPLRYHTVPMLKANITLSIPLTRQLSTHPDTRREIRSSRPWNTNITSSSHLTLLFPNQSTEPLFSPRLSALPSSLFPLIEARGLTPQRAATVVNSFPTP